MTENQNELIIFAERQKRLQEDLDKLAGELLLHDKRIHDLEKFKTWVTGISVGIGFALGTLAKYIKNNLPFS